MNENGKIFLALLGGLAAGAALGILFAPDKGSETRKKIVDSSKQLVDDLKSKAIEGIDSVKEKIYDKTNSATADNNGGSRVKYQS